MGERAFLFRYKSIRLATTVARRKSKPYGNLLGFAVVLLFVWLAAIWVKAPLVRALPAPLDQGSAAEAQSAHANRTHRHRNSDEPDPVTPDTGPIGSNAQSGVGATIHVALGIPSDSDPSDDYLIDHGVYVLSYNPVKNVPNWVGWALDRSFLGHVRRKNDFRPDPLLPADFYHVIPQDYHDSGYDRGHLCPSADRQDSPSDNSLTFLMTNIQPQLHELNEGPWEKLEEYERELARRHDAELFIVAGGIFDAEHQTIGHGVAVPKANFKIVVALRQGQQASDVKSDTKVIAVAMPNEAGVGSHPWTDDLTSVDAIEKATGYDFLSNVPMAVQDVIEAKVTEAP